MSASDAMFRAGLKQGRKEGREAQKQDDLAAVEAMRKRLLEEAEMRDYSNSFDAAVERACNEIAARIKGESLTGSSSTEQASNDADEDKPIARSCNLHVDCNLADEQARKRGRFASHCHDDCCEECFGY